MDVGALITRIRNDLEDRVDNDYRETIRVRFKMNVDSFLGVRTPVIRTLADQYYQEVKPNSPSERLMRCSDLLETGIYEFRILAFRWAHNTIKELSATDVDTTVSWIERNVTDWSDCDDLSMQVIGILFLRFPAQAIQVREWCGSPNRWVRRSAAVALIRTARRGLQPDLIFHVSRALANDRDDLVRKAHAWLLRETSRKRPDEVYQYLRENRFILPRAIVTMAARKLSPAQKKALRAV